MATLNELGLMSKGPFNPMQAMSDMFGLESIVQEITLKKVGAGDQSITPKAVLGPFYVENAPWRENGSSIIDKDAEGGKKVFLWGRVLDGATKKPVVGATVNTWQSSTNGLYDVQDDAQSLGNLRGRFKTDAEGRYSFYCLKPTAYPIPGGSKSILPGAALAMLTYLQILLRTCSTRWIVITIGPLIFISR